MSWGWSRVCVGLLDSYVTLEDDVVCVYVCVWVWGWCVWGVVDGDVVDGDVVDGDVVDGDDVCMCAFVCEAVIE